MLATYESEPGKGLSGLDDSSVGTVPDSTDWGVVYTLSPSHGCRGLKLYSIREKYGIKKIYIGSALPSLGCPLE